MITGRTWLITALIFLFVPTFFAQGNNDKILFLNFRFINGIPQLAGMKAAKGKLKRPKNTSFSQNRLTLEVLSKNNVLLFKNSTSDPLENIFEYPGEDGKIQNIKVIKDTADVILRVPYSSEIEKIQMYISSGENKSIRNTPGTSAAKYEFRINHSLIEGAK